MNRLSESTSLYLKQHAENPVHWQPWDQAALDDARDRDVPVLLSIGYSACHWCHVMAHESFEDLSTARLMNDLFVSIKVDREERPDLDKIYQLSHQLLTGRGGGWPLTVFLDPLDLIPFFAGTYFPVDSRHGMPAFADILKKLRTWFDSHRGEIKTQNANLQLAVANIQAVSGYRGELTDEPLARAIEAALQLYDPENGGFSGAPKFPQAPLLAFISNTCRNKIKATKLEAALHHTLHMMASGGLRDHLDGGFFRYTVDDSWTIPHFEKMLYDNALLLPLYAEAAARLRLSGRDDRGFAGIAEGIVAWLDAAMTSVEGGYCASIDADAGGVEGGFHVWTEKEIRSVLSDEQYHWFSRTYGLDQPANFEHQYWHLTRQSTTEALAANDEGLTRQIEALLLQSRTVLAALRDQRTHPTTDPKRLTGWNALVIEGLVRAGVSLDKTAWVDKAVEILVLLHTQMWSEGQLYTVRAGGQSHFPAYLDDYAWLLQANLSVLRERWHAGHYRFAIQLGDCIIEKFMASETGGFFFTASSEDVPMHRIRPNQDDATPGAAGSAIRALLQLGHLSGDIVYLDAARCALNVTSGDMQKHPTAYAGLLGALGEYLDPPSQVIITGTDPKRISAIHQALRTKDGVHCYAMESGNGELPGILKAFDDHAEVSAYVCRKQGCLPAVHSLEAVIQSLG